MTVRAEGGDAFACFD